MYVNICSYFSPKSVQKEEYAHMHIFMYPLSNLYVFFKIVSMLVLSFCFIVFIKR